WPFGLAGVFYLAYFQSGIILVSYILGDEAAAQYGVAITIMTAIYMFASLIYQKFLMPKIHRWANQDRVMLEEVSKNGIFLMLLLGAGMTIILCSMAPCFNL